MTIEEALAKITELETALAGEQKKVKDQNSYITRLENAAKGTAATPATTDPLLQKYLEQKMREDVLAQAVAQIKLEIDEPTYKAVEADFMEFIKNNMTKENTTVKYIVDAFSLVLGRALRSKDHPVHQVGKGGTPSATPAPQGPGFQNNASGVAAVAGIIASQPPVMNGREGATSGGLPNTEVKPKTTKEAHERLKARLGGLAQ